MIKRSPALVRPLLLAISLCVYTANIYGLQRDPNEPWWFEVETIIFERSITPEEINEAFDLSIKPIDITGLDSFIFATLQPDISLLQQGADACLTPKVPPAFPKQTAAPIKINQDWLSANVSELEKLFAENSGGTPEFLERVFDEVNLNDPEYIMVNRPSERLLQLLQNPFSDLETEYSKLWQSATHLAPRHEVFNIESKFTQNSVALPDTLYCQWPVEQEMFATIEGQILREARFLSAVDVTLDGIEYPYSEIAYTLPGEQLQLDNLKHRIQRTRGLNVLLHTAWRQDVKTGRDNAPWYRLNAGFNYSRDYSYTGIPKAELPDTELQEETQVADVVAQIRNIIDSPDGPSGTSAPPRLWQTLADSPLNQQFEEVWTLDGRLRIFIEYIGGTPYLHIDSELNYRLPVFVDWQKLEEPFNSLSGEQLTGENTENEGLINDIALTPSPNFLQPFYFDQLRRVISNEIHYFDHPLFGMVFQIRRYKRPEPEPEDIELLIDQASVR